MNLSITGTSQLDNIVQLITLLIICALIVIAAYITTKWVGKSTSGSIKNKNIKVIETYRLTGNKFVQIIQIADKTIAIAVCKDTIVMLTEVDPDALSLSEEPKITGESFKDIFGNLLKKEKKH